MTDLLAIPCFLLCEQCVCMTCVYLSVYLPQSAEVCDLGCFHLQMFYFFLPKKLNLFSRSFSLPSLLRMVTVSPELGEMGGMVMARLSRGAPGESPDPDGMELTID